MADDKLRQSATSEGTVVQPKASTRGNRGGSQARKSQGVGLGTLLTQSSVRNNRPDGKFFLTLPDGQSKEINLALFDENELRMLDEIDEDDSGEITLKEILKVKKSESYAKREADIMKKVVAGLLIFVVTLLAGLLGTSFAAAEMAKEMKSAAGGVMTTVSGDAVKMSSSDFGVGADGTLKVRILPTDSGASASGAAQQKLAETSNTTNSSSTGAALKTQPALAKKALASSLPDSFFIALKDITIYSDKGYVLKLAIHGFSRLPLLNSRCGNVVNLYTAWNNRITLDSTDLSFDESLSAAFAGAGFTVAMGGTGGRRLQDSHSVDGFFGALQGMSDSGGWTCADVPMPAMPMTYTNIYSLYQPCPVAGSGAPTEVSVCDSKFGGPILGAGSISQIDAYAILGKASQALATSASLKAPLYINTTIKQTRSPKYDIFETQLLNHPGQEKVTITDRLTRRTLTFQKLLKGEGADQRYYCSVVEPAASIVAEADAATRNPDLVKPFFELMDIVEEDGVMYRHFRLMTRAVYLTWMSSTSTAKPKADYFEYWDNAETLEPHRILNPDGSIIKFSQVAPNMTDSAAEDYILKTFLKGSRIADLFTCSTSEQTGNTGNPAIDARGAVPQMKLATDELSSADLSFYLKFNLDRMYEDPTKLTGWETAFKLAGTDGPLGAFYKFAVQTRSLLSLPDGCWYKCPAAYQVVADWLQVPGNDLCEVPDSGLGAFLTCVAGNSDPRCVGAEFMKTVSTCPSQSTGGRLLSHLRGPELILKEDGTSEIDLGTLHPVDQQEMAELLGYSNISDGRILLSKSETDALVPEDERFGLTDSPRRRLQAPTPCSPSQSGCLFSSFTPASCSFATRSCTGLTVQVELVGTAAAYPGFMTLNSGGPGGCVTTYQLTGQFAGSFCVTSNTIAKKPGMICGRPYSLGGSVGFSIRGLGFSANGVQYISATSSPTIEIGGNVNSMTQTVCTNSAGTTSLGASKSPLDSSWVCSSACDVGISEFFVTSNPLPGGHVVYAKLSYSTVTKDFDFSLGARIVMGSGVSQTVNDYPANII